MSVPAHHFSHVGCAITDRWRPTKHDALQVYQTSSLATFSSHACPLSALQLDGLCRTGVDIVYQKKACGSRADRPELTKALEYMREGGTLDGKKEEPP